ncbi:MAG: MBOAT family protein [Sphingobacteriales bacterium]|nr:MAG: MBOAT family protein [Sphingobacteriales bacterium]
MLFNSSQFAVFLPIVLFLYWFVTNKSLRWQNLLLLFSSYYFYSCWDWRFLFLLVFSTVLDYYTGLKIHRSESDGSKKAWLYTSVIINLGFLGLFKYYNFFAESFADFVSAFGFRPSVATINVILPVGISFYTFHGLSYVFDIYHKRIEPRTDFVNYSLFVSFFPLLVAGPIERATHLLPQMEKPRQFNKEQAIGGIQMMIWGFFKKVVVADSLAPVVNNIFHNYETYSGATLAYGAFLFAIQIYGDFSGYTDIALGTAKLFNFELLTNFRFPYFSRDIAEFWRRWHISLSSWFRDYVYIPLGGSKSGKAKAIRNTFIIFLVSGFWHGANWTFVAWGGIHALLFIPLLITGSNRKNMGEVGGSGFFPSIKELFQILITFCLVTIAWIFFRAPDIASASAYIARMFTDLLSPVNSRVLYSFDLAMIALLIAYDYYLLKRHNVKAMPKLALTVIHIFLLLIVLGSFLENKFSSQFIYFQF